MDREPATWNFAYMFFKVWRIFLAANLARLEWKSEFRDSESSRIPWFSKWSKTSKYGVQNVRYNLESNAKHIKNPNYAIGGAMEHQKVQIIEN